MCFLCNLFCNSCFHPLVLVFASEFVVACSRTIFMLIQVCVASFCNLSTRRLIDFSVVVFRFSFALFVSGTCCLRLLVICFVNCNLAFFVLVFFACPPGSHCSSLWFGLSPVLFVFSVFCYAYCFSALICVLQVVNYNIKGSQYVIAGELTALEALRLTLDTVCTLKPSDIRMRL